MKYSQTSIFITGQAMPSKGDAINIVYENFSLCLIVESKTDIIVNMFCTTALDETQEFLSQIIRGKNLITDVDEIVEVLRSRFLAIMQKPLIVALKDAQNKYVMNFSTNNHS